MNPLSMHIFIFNYSSAWEQFKMRIRANTSFFHMQMKPVNTFACSVQMMPDSKGLQSFGIG